ncbi:hypothetical protein GJ654_19995 [Rhodoblastus acidophilus]|uniref:Uncharacterized protein n=1 Tax=Rhodoblastus acidophilus TaxID=1074 RepID=A0A6N8DRL3_RHOAC|nr:hypothetical protein [Rhodoblastus acidophilus]
MLFRRKTAAWLEGQSGVALAGQDREDFSPDFGINPLKPDANRRRRPNDFQVELFRQLVIHAAGQCREIEDDGVLRKTREDASVNKMRQAGRNNEIDTRSLVRKIIQPVRGHTLLDQP